MKTKFNPHKFYLKNIIIASAGIVLFIAILLSVSAITIGFIKQADMKEDLVFEIQKRDVTIEALIISCELNHLIKMRRPDEIKTAIGEGNNAIN